MGKVSVRLWLGIGYLVSSIGLVIYLSATLTQEVQQPRATYSATSQRELARVASSLSLPAPHGGRFVILTAATWAYRQFVRNLACSLWRVGRYKLLLVALDARMYHAWMPGNVRIVLFNATEPPPFRYFRTAAFDSLSRQKLAATRAVLQTGHHVLFTDADVVWCDRAAEEIALQSLNTHLVVQRAAVRTQAINTGLYYARAADETIQFLKAAESFPLRTDDQTAANKIACDERFLGEQIHLGGGPRAHLHPNYCRWNDTATVAFLPDERYPLGCTKVLGKKMIRHKSHFIRSSCAKKRIALMHYSCYSGGRKKEIMRKHSMWSYDEHKGTCRT